MGYTATVRRLPLDPIGDRLPDDLGVRRSLRRGQTIVAQGAPAFGLVLVRGGLIFESSVSPEGRSTLHDVLGPGDLAGALPPDPAPASLRAAGPALVQVIDPGLLDTVFARRPALGACQIRGASGAFWSSRGRAASFSSSPPLPRDWSTTHCRRYPPSRFGSVSCCATVPIGELRGGSW